MKQPSRRSLLLLSSVLLAIPGPARAETPLPEHPRPDFERPDWANLNGTWRFRFDPGDVGEKEGWPRDTAGFDRQITVPFPWGSALSGVEDGADVGWYARELEVPEEWRSRRVFLVIGASDWHTRAWLDGELVGEHRGGYTPFSFELPGLRAGTRHELVLRVDDAPRAFRLEGKQGYGNARGLWQTAYLEARGDIALGALHLIPDVAGEKVRVEAQLSEPAPEGATLSLSFPNGEVASVSRPVPASARELRFEVPVASPHLWDLEDPYLYQVEARLESPGKAPDVVRTYFGMREISVAALPGAGFPYVALNGRPVYLQITLDQAYHPEGFYTFPDDAFVRDEVLRSRQIGLNAMRVHVKTAIPRKLYWADRLGVLIMADVPNSWGEPTPEMRHEVEQTLRDQIHRDRNHPSIFAWVPFNETWGLRTAQPRPGEDPERVYLPETKKWVESVVALARSLDDSRLVEDNSVCCGVGHTVTDLNSWHSYLPGWAWDEHLDQISEETFPGSQWNFEPGYVQGGQPNLNSEFGNVWGYEGSTGDVDWSWDYHLALNAFRRHPKVAGWLYTEHHDVVNEWNGYWRFDRSEKETGLGELVAGMTLRDLHAPLYVALGKPGTLCETVAGGSEVEVPLWASFMSPKPGPAELRLELELSGWDALGRHHDWWSQSTTVAYRPWRSGELEPARVPMPAGPAVAVLSLRLVDAAGGVLHRNFTTFDVAGDAPGEIELDGGRRGRLLSVPAGSAAEAEWSLGHWSVLDGAKLAGAGTGHFTYRIPWDRSLDPDRVESASFVVEASAKKLLGKDRKGDQGIEGDFMRGRGTLDPGLNPNAYPMTDQDRFPSAVTVRVNGVLAGRVELGDDPADHRGILSWHSQLRDRKLREAGSYGQLLDVPIPREALERAAGSGELVVRLEVAEALPGGLAIYGRRFGRYPLDPTVVVALREP